MIMRPTLHDQSGTTMIEVLVAIVIVVLGLLGLAGLQSRATLAEMESFQRAQALLLMQDMVDRINANRKTSMSYVTGTAAKGAGNSTADCSALTGAPRDLCEWNNALLGAGESAGGANVGAMIGARGCVEVQSAAMPRRFLVSVVWQGMNATASPGATACGAGSYDAADKTRRVVSSRVTIGCLQNDPVSLVCVTP